MAHAAQNQTTQFKKKRADLNRYLCKEGGQKAHKKVLNITNY